MNIKNISYISAFAILVLCAGFIAHPEITEAKKLVTKSKYQTINLNSANAPLSYTFEIPSAYVAYVEEGHEGGYGARIKVLKQSSTGVFENAGVSFVITAESTLNANGKTGDENIDEKFRNNKPSSVYTTLSGNKAVSVPGEMVSGSVNTTGYIHNKRMPQFPYYIEAYYIPTNIKGSMLSKAEYERILKTFKVVEKSY